LEGRLARFLRIRAHGCGATGTNRLLAVAAGIEAATGLALMVDPLIFSQLLLGAEISGAAIAVGRVAGFGLLALGLAGWPGAGNAARPLRALLTYNVLIVLYLLLLGVCGEWVGRLLWPAVVLHAVLTVLLARAWLAARKTAVRG
jgi:hypothetical protein